MQIISLEPDEISKICVDYKDKNNESFCIEKKNEGYFIGQQKIKKEDGDYYFSNLQNIVVTKFENDPALEDSLKHTQPDFTVSIYTKGKNYIIKGYAKDKDSFRGMLDGSLFEMKYFVLDPILRYKSDFEFDN